MSGSIPSLGARERELLVNCARIELGDALEQRTRALLLCDLDWDRAVLFAEAHSVAPLLHYQLERLGAWAEVPPTARQRLLQLTHRAGYRNRLFSAGLGELLDLFAQREVPVVVLKGLSLAELIYPVLSLRPLIDLNLLIPPTYLRTTRALLLRHGYVETVSRRSPFYRWSHSQLVVERPGAFRLVLMLQWNLVSWSKMHAIDLARLWREAEPVRISARDTRIPSPVDFVLYLSLQADKYAYLNGMAVDLEDPSEFVFDERTQNRLIRFTDLHEVIRHYDGRIDWKELVERARACGIAESVYTSLRCVERLFQARFEPSTLEGLRVTPRPLRRLVGQRLLGPRARPARTMEKRVRRWWLRQDAVAQRRWIRFLELIEFVFPPPGVLRRRYEFTWGRAAALAYPFHVADGLLRCALHVPLWTYHRIKQMRPRGPAHPPVISRPPPMSHQEVGSA